MKTTVIMLVLLMLSVTVYAVAIPAGSWIGFDVPGAGSTAAIGLEITNDTINVIGEYVIDVTNEYAVSHGFWLTIAGTNWTWRTLDPPDSFGTFLSAKDGNKIVGTYYDRYDNCWGVVYDIPTATWTQLWTMELYERLGIWDIRPNNIRDGKMVGTCSSVDYYPYFERCGFIHILGSQDWTVFSLDEYTDVYDYYGNDAVGTASFFMGLDWNACGFTYDGTNCIGVVMPPLAQNEITVITSKWGDTMVGYYPSTNGWRGVMCNKSAVVSRRNSSVNWTTLNFPGACDTYPSVIRHNVILGAYYNPGATNTLARHGFLYAIPGPSLAMKTSGSATAMALQGLPADEFVVESSTNLVNWVYVTNVVVDLDGNASVQSSTNAKTIFYRVNGKVVF